MFNCGGVGRVGLTCVMIILDLMPGRGVGKVESLILQATILCVRVCLPERSETGGNVRG